MRMLFTSLLSVSSIVLSGFAAQAKIPSANAAELTCHRIERLVILKKIDAAFLNGLKSISVEVLPPAAPGQPAFKTTSLQEADAGKQASSLVVTLDENGKPVGQPIVAAGIASAKPTVWPGVDPVTILENSLHWVEQNAAKADVAKFSSGLKSMSIEPGTMGAKSVGKVEILSTDTTQTMNIYMGVDGSFISYEVVN